MREALKLLEAEGYVTGDSYRGALSRHSTWIFDRDTESAHPAGNAACSRRGGECVGSRTSRTAECWRPISPVLSPRATTRPRVRRTIVSITGMFEIARMPQTLHFVQILWARYPFDLINQLKGRVSRAADEHDEMLKATHHLRCRRRDAGDAPSYRGWMARTAAPPSRLIRGKGITFRPKAFPMKKTLFLVMDMINDLVSATGRYRRHLRSAGDAIVNAFSETTRPRPSRPPVKSGVPDRLCPRSGFPPDYPRVSAGLADFLPAARESACSSWRTPARPSIAALSTAGEATSTS